jgi:glutamyl-tRNA synthetase
MNHIPARVRFAPSPTGYLHIGGARSALFNWLFARHTGGQFLLRIEDTDQKRYVADSVSNLMANLRWLGLDWDEGPDVGGPYGPYTQTERAALYQHWAHWLVEQGHAYHCYCTPERLEAMRAEQMANKQPPGYDRRCRHLTVEERAARAAEGLPYVIRFATPREGNTVVHDAVRGEMVFANQTLDDTVLLKSDGLPTYHLAVVVDDHAMQITHVMRADEWIASAPRHVLLYQAFAWAQPVWVHLPVILDPSGKGKMSKRKVQVGGKEYPVFVEELREGGYLPEATFNFLANVGWSMGGDREVFMREEAIAAFSLDGINPAPAALPYSKLEWLNGVYIRALPPAELKVRLIPFLVRDLGLDAETLAGSAVLDILVPEIQERIKTLNEASAMLDFALVTELPDYDSKLLVAKGLDAAGSHAALAAARDVLVGYVHLDDPAAVEQALRELADARGLSHGQLFGILRMAISGKKVTPPLFASMQALGQQVTLRRIEVALGKLAAL